MPQLSEAHKARLESILTEAVESKTVPALFLGITDADGPLYLKTVGNRWFDDPSSGPLDEDAVFAAFSQTKLVTTIAVLQLIEQRKLSLSTNAEEIIPELANPVILTGRDSQGNRTYVPASSKITVGQLLNHTSGMDSTIYAPKSELNPTAFLRPTGYDYAHEVDPVSKYYDLVKGSGAFPGVPLRHEPGTNFAYGLSTDSAGFIVEKISGKTLEQYFKDHIFSPLGITSASFHLTSDLRSRLFPMHGRDAAGGITRYTKGPLLSCDRETGRVNIHLGSAGLYLSQKDYLTMLRHLLCIKTRRIHNGILAPTSVDQMFAPTLPPLAAEIVSVGVQINEHLGWPDNAAQFSRGLLLNTEDIPGRRRKGSGAWGGLAMTSFFLDPSSGIAVVMGTQLLPGSDKKYNEVYRKVEEALYQALDEAV